MANSLFSLATSRFARVLLFGCLLLHFFFVCTKAIRGLPNFVTNPDSNPRLDALVDLYTQTTVMQADYSFFSPDIAPDTSLEIIVRDKSGRTLEAPFRIPNGEVKVRMHTLLLAFHNVYQTRELMARSWAARAFEQYPDTDTITVSVYDRQFPTMKEIQNGKQSSLSKFFEVVFRAPPDPSTATRIDSSN